MSRFSSFQHAPAETRRILRDRFASRLRRERHRRFLDPDLALAPDEAVLHRLADLTVASNSAWTVAELAYATAAPTAAEPKDLQDLADLGWVRRVWGRAEVGRELRRGARNAASGSLDAFRQLLADLHAQHFEDQAGGTVGVNPEALVCLTPEWVAARLWEVVLARQPDSAQALRQWVDLWGVLQHPEFAANRSWSASDAATFREAAFAVIASDPALGDWTATLDLWARELALAYGLPFATAKERLPPAPRTLVDRALWSASQRMEASVYGALEDCDDLFGLVRLLLTDADDADHGPAPHPLVVRIATLAMDRAELFIDLLFQVNAKPRLLADLVLHPPTAGLACLLVAQWRSPSGAWDRDLVDRDHRSAETEAFADAVALLGDHLRAGRTPPPEAAALLDWFHAQAGRGFIDEVSGLERRLGALRRELGTCSSPDLLEMVSTLARPDVEHDAGTSAFAAMIDLIDLGALENEVDAEMLVTAYAQAIDRGDYGLTVHRIGTAGAAALARVSERTPALRAKFLKPLDVPARLAAADRDTAYAVADALGRGLRAHIRVLCRAIIGGPVEQSTDLFDALLESVRRAAVQHAEKGRVAGFAPRFETQIAAPASDRPLADDLAAVFHALSAPDQERLLAVVLETDEPLILAQLMSRCPANLRKGFERRIDTLAPADAARIAMLPEMQARIDELLTAGAAGAAASYMAAEAELTKGRTIPGRELKRFQSELRLHFLREDWAAIAATPKPKLTAQMDQAAAEETLRQFRALAALRGPNADAAVAKSAFADLFDKRPTAAFAANWLAAEICDLLQGDTFGLLKGPKLRQGQAAWAEVERMMALLPEGPPEEVLEGNRALLLLALGDPRQALAVLSNTQLVRLEANVAAYRALALARIGQRAEATTVLDAAEHSFGRTEVLTATREHIANGAPFLAAPEVSIHDDLVDNVASAIARFRQMNPVDQARVLHRKADPFEALLVDHVRAAADAIVDLVPMMRGVKIDEIEDDLTAVLKHVLAARVQFLGWSVSDQSKGGFSGAGNPGERDLLIGWGGSTLAILEAVVCARPLTQDSMKADLESHFQKLLGYGVPRIFFHLTYVYIDDLIGVVRTLESAAETMCPPGFAYLGREPIPHEDSRPPGFVAQYSADTGLVKVVFLVLNLVQERQRQAAKAAAKTKSRKAPKKPKG